MTRYADDLAFVHQHGFADLARGAARFVREHIGAAPQRIVDLGCGSGEVLRVLSDAGHDVLGVDLSAAMLRLAKKRAPRARLLRGSLYDVPLPQCDVVLAIGEPLNYLEPNGRARALAPFWRKVHRALAPGGQLLFDVIVARPGPSLSRRSWVGGARWAVMVETREEPDRRHLVRDVTSFVERGRGYRRTHEVHQVRIFDTSRLVRELASAGFSVRVRTSYGAHALALRRRAFLCTKR